MGGFFRSDTFFFISFFFLFYLFFSFWILTDTTKMATAHSPRTRPITGGASYVAYDNFFARALFPARAALIRRMWARALFLSPLDLLVVSIVQSTCLWLLLVASVTQKQLKSSSLVHRVCMIAPLTASESALSLHPLMFSSLSLGVCLAKYIF